MVQRKNKVSTEHLIMPESKKVFKKFKDWDVSKALKSYPEKPPNYQKWNNFSNKIKYHLIITEV